jgi:hypothetical protein
MRAWTFAFALLLLVSPPARPAEPAGPTVVLQLPASMSPDAVRGLITELAAKGARPAARGPDPAPPNSATSAELAAAIGQATSRALRAIPHFRRLPQHWIDRVEARGRYARSGLVLLDLAGLAAPRRQDCMLNGSSDRPERSDLVDGDGETQCQRRAEHLVVGKAEPFAEPDRKDVERRKRQIGRQPAGAGAGISIAQKRIAEAPQDTAKAVAAQGYARVRLVAGNQPLDQVSRRLSEHGKHDHDPRVEAEALDRRRDQDGDRHGDKQPMPRCGDGAAKLVTLQLASGAAR